MSVGTGGREKDGEGLAAGNGEGIRGTLPSEGNRERPEAGRGSRGGAAPQPREGEHRFSLWREAPRSRQRRGIGGLSGALVLAALLILLGVPPSLAGGLGTTPPASPDPAPGGLLPPGPPLAPLFPDLLLPPGEPIPLETARRILRLRALERRLFAGPARGVLRGRSLILIQVESLQAFAVGLSLDGVPVTPNIDRFLSEGIRFDRVYEQTAVGHTADAELLALCSLYPLREGWAYDRSAERLVEGLPRALKRAGYATAAFHGNGADAKNREAVYPRLGFDRFWSKRDFRVDEVTGLGLSDRSFLRQAAARIAALPRPFFAFLITLSSHDPFLLSPSLEDPGMSPLPLGRWKGTYLGNVLECLHYTDAALGRFFEDLRERGLWEECAVALYGDHWAVPLEHRSDLEALTGMPPEGFPATWKALDRVPLGIRGPGIPATALSTPCGQIDIAPTLAGLLDLDLPLALGRDLLSRGDPPGKVLFRNGGLIRDDLWLLPAAEDRAYDLASFRPVPVPEWAPRLREEAERELALSDAILDPPRP